MGKITWATNGLRGKFVVLDGPDGAGKTAVARLLAKALGETGLSVTCCRDPGGTTIGDRIRSILLDHDLTDMDVRCEVLLFMASRAQLVSEVIRPALDGGGFVLCDRFVSSTLAYQMAVGADFDDIIQLARHAIGETWPDLTIVLDVPTEVGFDRISQGRGTGAGPDAPSFGDRPGSMLDGMERRPREFHEAVRANFLSLPGRYPTRVEVLDATARLESVVQNVLAKLEQAIRA